MTRAAILVDRIDKRLKDTARKDQAILVSRDEAMEMAALLRTIDEAIIDRDLKAGTRIANEYDMTGTVVTHHSAKPCCPKHPDAKHNALGCTECSCPKQPERADLLSPT